VGVVDVATLGPFLEYAQMKTDDFKLNDFIIACVAVTSTVIA